MATLTALKPRPYIFCKPIVQIELVRALPEDLKTYDPVHQMEVLRPGLIFWLKSCLTGKIEGTPNVITPNTNAKDIKEWMDCNMIYIAKEPFNRR
jgi:hypothetical protein